MYLRIKCRKYSPEFSIMSSIVRQYHIRDIAAAARRWLRRTLGSCSSSRPITAPHLVCAVWPLQLTSFWVRSPSDLLNLFLYRR